MTAIEARAQAIQMSTVRNDRRRMMDGFLKRPSAETMAAARPMFPTYLMLVWNRVAKHNLKCGDLMLGSESSDYIKATIKLFIDVAIPVGAENAALIILTRERLVEDGFHCSEIKQDAYGEEYVFRVGW